jgi:protein MpaA
MKIRSIRNYADIQTRIASALDGVMNAVPLGIVENNTSSYPIDKVVLGSGNPKRVLISAGIHGDEPAGVETICSFIERKEYLSFFKNWEITLVPCINPFGYERGTRNNHEDMDLNRKFKSSSPPREVSLIQSVFERPFDLTMELHEDEDSSGYYLFYSFDSGFKTELAHQILNEVQPIMPVNRDADIDGFPAQAGVIERVSEHETMDWWPMALYSLSKGTRICLTLETAPQFPMENRVNAHLQAIRTALDSFPG